MAGCGSASSFNRYTLDVARYRRSLAPRLAPLPGFLGATAPTRLTAGGRTENPIVLPIPAWPVDKDGCTARGNRLDARQTAVRNATGRSTIHARPTLSHSFYPSTPQPPRSPGTSSNPNRPARIPQIPWRAERPPCSTRPECASRNYSSKPDPSLPAATNSRADP